MSCDERKEKRREDAHKWECSQDLLSQLCQFAVIDSWRSGVRDFCGRMDGAGQERRDRHCSEGGAEDVIKSGGYASYGLLH